MKKLLVPIDFSESSKSALKYAFKLAEVSKAEVHILYVYSIFETEPDRILGQTHVKMVDSAVKAYSDVEAWVKKINKNSRTKKHIWIADGIPEVKIVEMAKKHKVNYIVIGRTGNSALQRFLLGSTTANVIKGSPVPVLIVPKEATWKKIKRVVFTTDLSNDTLKHVGEVANFARNLNAELVFLYIDTGSALTSDEKVMEMTNKLRKRVKYNKVSGFICEDITVREGFSYYFSHYRADMAVMVTHHYHFPQILWKRSLTRKLSASFSIPLLALVENK